MAPSHRATASTSSLTSSFSPPSAPTLPSKFRVPPLPPRIHRKLVIRRLKDGLLLAPVEEEAKTATDGEDHGVLVSWGPKSTVRQQPPPSALVNHPSTPATEGCQTLEIGGIIGLIKLWETSYLLIFLQPPPNIEPTCIFPPTVKREFPSKFPRVTPMSAEEEDPLMRSLRAISEREGFWGSPVNRSKPLKENNEGGDDSEDVKRKEREVFQLKNVYAIPLTPEGSEAMMQAINASLAKSKAYNQTPPPAQTPTSSSDSPKPPRIFQNAQEALRQTLLPEPSAGDNDETPAQALARVLNPQRWNLGKFGRTQSSSSGKSTSGPIQEEEEEGGDTDVDPLSGERVASVVEAREVLKEQEQAGYEQHSGDLGESFGLARDSNESETKSILSSSAPTPPTGTAEDSMPDPEETMSLVSGTQTSSERAWQTQAKKRASAGVSIDWSKMNPFAKKSQPSGGNDSPTDKIEQAQDLDAKVPGFGAELELDDGLQAVTDGLVVENSAKSASVPSQRRDLEAKIIRETVKELGAGGFFYSFETDLSHNLQHKRKQLSARSQSTGLLTSLLKKDALTVPTAPSNEAGIEESSRPQGHASGLEPAAEILDSPRLSPKVSSESEFSSANDSWVEPDVNLPLWRRVDSRFMWNTYLAKDFIDLGLHAYILPIIQGWVQATRFYIGPPKPANKDGGRTGSPAPRPSLDNAMDPPSTPVDMVLISRRMKDRAGLRFQRRGIDEDGRVANFVETEMLIRILCEGRWNVFSFVQVRGSIPLFWSQSSTLTSMKPAPVLDRPVDQTLGITRLHFEDLKRRYGPQTVVNLAETTGKESVVTNGFEEAVKLLSDEDVRYESFDFHNECKGMRYENISKLINNLGETISDQGYFWTNQGEVMREQKGTFRVNCIDCLDRTNVVESALARHVLGNELTQVGLVPDVSTSDMEMKFNDVWANNGDQISRIYAGTSALKGDFTRTGKRDLSGMVHDGVNSVTRMFSGAVSDYFTQAVISYMVGQRSIAVFSEFVANLEASDGIHLVRLSRIRAAAIEICSARVIEDGEHKIAGWTLFSPEEANVRLTTKLEEKVLLLTKAALHVVSFDYNLEKVIASTRIPLRNVVSIKKGAYILNPIQEAGRDREENAGFQIFFKPSEGGTRLTSYAVLNTTPASPLPEAKKNRNRAASNSGYDTRPEGTAGLDYFAFKALPKEFVTSGSPQMDDEEDADNDRGKDESCREVVDRIVQRIKDECYRAAGSVGGYVGGHARSENFVVEADVVSLAEAQKSTSLVTRADYAIKRLLWLP